MQTELEVVVAHAALAAETARREMLEKQKEEDAESEKNRKSWAKWKRNMYVGGAAVAGGALLAVTGGGNPLMAFRRRPFSSDCRLKRFLHLHWAVIVGGARAVRRTK